MQSVVVARLILMYLGEFEIHVDPICSCVEMMIFHVLIRIAIAGDLDVKIPCTETMMLV